MSEQSELRHRCRNRQCRSRLKEATDNPRRAFCTRFCFDSFYRKRCRVCERDIDTDPQTGRRRQRLDQRKFCGRRCIVNAMVNARGLVSAVRLGGRL